MTHPKSDHVDEKIFTGADARRGRGRGRGLVIERIRTEDGTDSPATGFFRTMGDHLVGQP